MVSIKKDERLVTLKRLTTLKHSKYIAIGIGYYEKNIATEIGSYEKEDNQATLIKSGNKEKKMFPFYDP